MANISVVRGFKLPIYSCHLSTRLRMVPRHYDDPRLKSAMRALDRQRDYNPLHGIGT
jgi:hypothetical protein